MIPLGLLAASDECMIRGSVDGRANFILLRRKNKKKNEGREGLEKGNVIRVMSERCLMSEAEGSVKNGGQGRMEAF